MVDLRQALQPSETHARDSKRLAGSQSSNWRQAASDAKQKVVQSSTRREAASGAKQRVAPSAGGPHLKDRVQLGVEAKVSHSPVRVVSLGAVVSLVRGRLCEAGIRPVVSLLERRCLKEH